MGHITYRAAARRLRTARNTLCACLISTLIVSSFSSVSALSCQDDGWTDIPNLGSFDLTTIGTVTKGAASDTTQLPPITIGKAAYTTGAVWLGTPIGLLDEFRVRFTLNIAPGTADPTAPEGSLGGHCPVLYDETCDVSPTDAEQCLLNTVNTLGNRSCPSTVTTCQTKVTPSSQCGSEGVAFVIQNQDALALGSPKAGLGYRGIRESVAVEFDLKESGSTDGKGQHMAVRASPKGRLSRDNTAANEDNLATVEASLYTASANGQDANVLITHARCDSSDVPNALATPTLTTKFRAANQASDTPMPQPIDLPSFVYERRDGFGLQTRSKVLSTFEQAKTAYIGFTGAVGREPTQFTIRNVAVQLRQVNNIYYGSAVPETECKDKEPSAFGDMSCDEYIKKYVNGDAQRRADGTVGLTGKCDCATLKRIYSSATRSDSKLWQAACVSDRARIGNMCQAMCTNVCDASIRLTVVPANKTETASAFTQYDSNPVRIRVVPSSLDDKSGFYTSPLAQQLIKVTFDQVDKCRVTSSGQVVSDETMGMFEYLVLCPKATGSGQKYTGYVSPVNNAGLKLPFTITTTLTGKATETPYAIERQQSDAWMSFFSGIPTRMFYRVFDRWVDELNHDGQVVYENNLKSEERFPLSAPLVIRDNGVDRVESLITYPDATGDQDFPKLAASVTWTPQLASADDDGVFLKSVGSADGPLIVLPLGETLKVPVFHGYLDPSTLKLSTAAGGKTAVASLNPLSITVTGSDAAGNPMKYRNPYPIFPGQVIGLRTDSFKDASLRISEVSANIPYVMDIDLAAIQYYYEKEIANSDCPRELPACPMADPACDPHDDPTCFNPVDEELLPACCATLSSGKKAIRLGVSYFVQGDITTESEETVVIAFSVAGSRQSSSSCIGTAFQQHPEDFLKQDANIMTALALYDILPDWLQRKVRDAKYTDVIKKAVSDAWSQDKKCVAAEFLRVVGVDRVNPACPQATATSFPAAAFADFCGRFPAFGNAQYLMVATQQPESIREPIDPVGSVVAWYDFYNILHVDAFDPYNGGSTFEEGCTPEGQTPLQIVSAPQYYSDGTLASELAEGIAYFSGACSSMTFQVTDPTLAGDWTVNVRHPCEGKSQGCVTPLSFRITPGEAKCLVSTPSCIAVDLSSRFLNVAGLYTVPEQQFIRAGQSFQIRARMLDEFGNEVTVRPTNKAVTLTMKDNNCIVVMNSQSLSWTVKCRAPETFTASFVDYPSETVTLTVTPQNGFYLKQNDLSFIPAQPRACSVASLLVRSSDLKSMSTPLPADIDKLIVGEKKVGVDSLFGQNNGGFMTVNGQTYPTVWYDMKTGGSPGSQITVSAKYRDQSYEATATLLPSDVCPDRSTCTDCNQIVKTGTRFTAGYIPRDFCGNVYKDSVQGARITMSYTKLNGDAAELQCTGQPALATPATASACSAVWENGAYKIEGIILSALKTLSVDLNFAFARVDFETLESLDSKAKAYTPSSSVASFIQTRRLASGTLSRQHHAKAMAQTEATQASLATVDSTITYTATMVVEQEPQPNVDQRITLDAYSQQLTTASAGFDVLDRAGLAIVGKPSSAFTFEVTSGSLSDVSPIVSWKDGKYFISTTPSAVNPATVAAKVMLGTVQVATVTVNVKPVVSLSSSSFSLDKSKATTPNSCVSSTCRISVSTLGNMRFQVDLKNSVGTPVADNDQADRLRKSSWELVITRNGVATVLPAQVEQTGESTADPTSSVRLLVSTAFTLTGPATISARTTGANGQTVRETVTVEFFPGTLDLVQSLSGKSATVTPNIQETVYFTPLDANNNVLSSTDLDAWLGTDGVQFSLPGSAKEFGFLRPPSTDVALPFFLRAVGTYTVTVFAGGKSQAFTLIGSLGDVDVSKSTATAGCCLPDFCGDLTVAAEPFIVNQAEGATGSVLVALKDRAGNTLSSDALTSDLKLVITDESGNAVSDTTNFNIRVSNVQDSTGGRTLSFRISSDKALGLPSQAFGVQVTYKNQNVGTKLAVKIKSPWASANTNVAFPQVAWVGSQLSFSNAGAVAPASGWFVANLHPFQFSLAGSTADSVALALTVEGANFNSAVLRESRTIAKDRFSVMFTVKSDLQSKMTCAPVWRASSKAMATDLIIQRTPTQVSAAVDKTPVGPNEAFKVTATVGVQGSSTELFKMPPGTTVTFSLGSDSGCKFASSGTAVATVSAGNWATQVEASASCTMSGDKQISVSVSGPTTGTFALPSGTTIRNASPVSVTVNPGSVATITIGKDSLGPLALKSNSLIPFRCETSPGSWICCRDSFGNTVPKCTGIVAVSAWKEAYTYNQANTQAFIQLKDNTNTMTAVVGEEGVTLNSEDSGIYTLTVQTASGASPASASVTFSPGTISLANSELKCTKAVYSEADPEAEPTQAELKSADTIETGDHVTCAVVLKNTDGVVVAADMVPVLMTVWRTDLTPATTEAETSGVNVERSFTQAGSFLITPRLNLGSGLVVPNGPSTATLKFFLTVKATRVALGSSTVDMPASVQSGQEFTSVVHWLDSYGNPVAGADAAQTGAKLCVCRNQDVNFVPTDDANPLGCLQVKDIGSETSLRLTITITKDNMLTHFVDQTHCQSVIYNGADSNQEGVTRTTRVIPGVPSKVVVDRCGDCNYDVLTIKRKAACTLRAFDANGVPVAMLNEQETAFQQKPDQCPVAVSAIDADGVSSDVATPVWRDLIQWCGDLPGAVVSGSSGDLNKNNDFVIEFYPHKAGNLADSGVSCLKVSVPGDLGDDTIRYITIEDPTNTPVVVPEVFEDTRGVGLLRFQIDAVAQTPITEAYAPTLKAKMEAGLVTAIAAASTAAVSGTADSTKREVQGSVVITDIQPGANSTAAVITGYFNYVPSAATPLDATNARLETLIADLAKVESSVILKSHTQSVKEIQAWLRGATVSKVYDPATLPAKARLSCSGGKVELPAGSSFLASLDVTTVSGAVITAPFSTWLPFQSGADASVRPQGAVAATACQLTPPAGSSTQFTLSCPALTVAGVYELRLIVKTTTSTRNLLSGDSCVVSVKAGLPDPFRSTVEPLVPRAVGTRVTVNAMLRDSYGNPAPMGSDMTAYVDVVSDRAITSTSETVRVTVGSDFSITDVPVPSFTNDLLFKLLVTGTVDGVSVTRQVESTYSQSTARGLNTNSEVSDSCTDASSECHDPSVENKFARVGSPADFRVIVRDDRNAVMGAQPRDVVVCLKETASSPCSPSVLVTSSNNALLVQYTPRTAGTWTATVRLANDQNVVKGGLFNINVLPADSSAFDVSVPTAITASETSRREVTLALRDAFGNRVSNSMAANDKVRSALEAQNLKVTLSNKGCSCDDKLCAPVSCELQLLNGKTDYERCSAPNLRRAGTWTVAVSSAAGPLPCNSESCTVNVAADSVSPVCSIVVLQRHLADAEEAPIVVAAPPADDPKCPVKGRPGTATDNLVVDVNVAFRVLIDGRDMFGNDVGSTASLEATFSSSDITVSKALAWNADEGAFSLEAKGTKVGQYTLQIGDANNSNKEKKTLHVYVRDCNVVVPEVPVTVIDYVQSAAKVFVAGKEVSTVSAGTAYEVRLFAVDAKNQAVSFTQADADSITIVALRVTTGSQDTPARVEVKGSLKRFADNRAIVATIDAHQIDASKAGTWYVFGLTASKAQTKPATLQVTAGPAATIWAPASVTVKVPGDVVISGVYFTDVFGNRVSWPADLTAGSIQMFSLVDSTKNLKAVADAGAQTGKISLGDNINLAGTYQIKSTHSRFHFSTGSVAVNAEGCTSLDGALPKITNAWYAAQGTSPLQNAVVVGSNVRVEVNIKDFWGNACVKADGAVRLMYGSEVVSTMTYLPNKPAGTYQATVKLEDFQWGTKVNANTETRKLSIAMTGMASSKDLPTDLQLRVGAPSANSEVTVKNTYTDANSDNGGLSWSTTATNQVGACDDGVDCSFTVSVVAKDSFGNKIDVSAWSAEKLATLGSAFRVQIGGYEIDYATASAQGSTVTLAVVSFVNAKDLSGVSTLSVILTNNGNRIPASTTYSVEFLPAKPRPTWLLTGDGVAAGNWRYTDQEDKSVTVRALPQDINGILKPGILPVSMKVEASPSGSCKGFTKEADPVESDAYAFKYNLPKCDCSYRVVVTLPSEDLTGKLVAESDYFAVGCERASSGNSGFGPGGSECKFTAVAGQDVTFTVECKSDRSRAALCGDQDTPFHAYATINPNACPGSTASSTNIPIVCQASSDNKQQTCTFKPTSPGKGTIQAFIYGSAIGTNFGCNQLTITGGQPASILYSPSQPTVRAGVVSSAANAISFTVRDKDNNCIPDTGSWSFSLEAPAGGLPEGAVENSGAVTSAADGTSSITGITPTVARTTHLVMNGVSGTPLSIPLVIEPNTDPSQLRLCGAQGIRTISQDASGTALFSYGCGWTGKASAVAGTPYAAGFCVCDANNNLVTGDLLASGVMTVTAEQNGRPAGFTASRDQTSTQASYSVYGTVTVAQELAVTVTFKDGRQFKQVVTVRAGSPDPERSCFILGGDSSKCATNDKPVAVRASRTPYVLSLVSRDKYDNLRQKLSVAAHQITISSDNGASPRVTKAGIDSGDDGVLTRVDGTFDLDIEFNAIGSYTITSTVNSESGKQVFRVTVTAGAAFAPASEVTVVPDKTQVPDELKSSVAVVAYASAAYINAELSVKDEFGNQLDTAVLNWKVYGTLLQDVNDVNRKSVNVGSACVSGVRTTELRVVNADGTLGDHIRRAGSYQVRACIIPEGEDCATFKCTVGTRTETVLFQLWADPTPSAELSYAYVGEEGDHSVWVENKGSLLVSVVPRDQYGNQIYQNTTFGIDESADFVDTEASNAPATNSLGVWEVNLKDLTLEGKVGASSITYTPAFVLKDEAKTKITMSQGIYIAVAPGPLHRFTVTCVSASPIVGKVPPTNPNRLASDQECRGQNCNDKCCCDTSPISAGATAYIQLQAFDEENNLRAGNSYDFTSAAFELLNSNGQAVKFESEPRSTKTKGDGSGVYDFSFVPQQSSTSNFRLNAWSVEKEVKQQSDAFKVTVGPSFLPNAQIVVPDRLQSQHSASFQVYLFDKYLSPTNKPCGTDCKVTFVLRAKNPSTTDADTTWMRKDMTFSASRITADGIQQLGYNVTLDLGMSGDYDSWVEVTGVKEVKTGPSFRIKAGQWQASNSKVITPPSVQSGSEPTGINQFKILEKSVVYVYFADSYNMPLTDEDLAEQEVTSLRLTASRLVAGTDTLESGVNTYSSKGTIVGNGVVKFAFPGENDITNYETDKANIRADTSRSGGLPFPEVGEFDISLESNDDVAHTKVVVYGGPMSEKSYICTKFTKTTTGSCADGLTLIRGSHANFCCSKLADATNTLVTGYSKNWYLVPIDAGDRFTLSEATEDTPTVVIEQGVKDVTLKPKSGLIWDSDLQVYVMTFFPEVADPTSNFESKVTARLGSVKLLEGQDLRLRVVADNCPDGKLRCPGVLCLPNIGVSCEELPEFNPEKHCVATYTECEGLESSQDGNACPTATQTRCPSWTAKSGQCVSSFSLCGCPTDHTMCPDESKCVTDVSTQCSPTSANLAGLDNGISGGSSFLQEASAFVEVTATGAIKQHSFAKRSLSRAASQCTNPVAPYYCARTARCVANENSCASKAECPTGYYLCSEGYCLDEIAIGKNDKTAACTNAAKWEACPSVQPIRCHDGRCVSVMTACPSQMVCPPGQIRCLSDNSCATSRALCPPPPICKDNGLTFACPDGSCRAKQSDCPSAPTCTTPDQPFRVLCPDYSCVNDQAECAEPVKCGKGEVRCPAGNCASNYERCSTPVTCPLGEVKCADGYCAPDTSKCAAREESWNIAPASVKVNSFICPDSRVVLRNSALSLAEQKALCPTLVSCPFDRPVRCSDNSCVVSVFQCPLSSGVDSVRVVCSKELGRSYRCPNGECRRSAFDCPTDATCTPDQPVKCQDGSCVKQVSDCLPLPSCPAYTVRCPGSSACAQSRDLCPSSVMCGLDEIKCESGRCAKTMAECTREMEDPVTLPCAKGQFRCPDGTCLATGLGVDACPTVRVCPPDAPVRCDDNSCQATFYDCPATSNCNTGMRQCPDGTCAISTCGTPITCPVSAPIKCWDGSCKVTIADCPVQRSCPDDLPFLCPDGQCVFSRTYCRTLETCRADRPIKCPSLECVSTLDQCANKLVEAGSCPLGQNVCPDGSCVIDKRDCKEVQCPATKPFRCPNGMCATYPMPGQSISDDCWKDNGCPPQLPFMCWNGACATDPSQCKDELVAKNTCAVDPALTTVSLGKTPTAVNGGQILSSSKDKATASTTTTTTTTVTFSRCADGVCRANCAGFEVDGCPTGQRRCADGSCVAKTAQCPIMVCPSNTPYKCDDGVCVKSRRFCPAEVQAPFKCPENQVACANGLCVSSADLCMPLFACPTGLQRCEHAGFSCRKDCGSFSSSDLPNGCPVVDGKRLSRCPNGSCAMPGMCREADGCVKGFKRGLNGECVQSQDAKSELLIASQVMSAIIYQSSLRSPDLSSNATEAAKNLEAVAANITSLNSKLSVLMGDRTAAVCPVPVGSSSFQPFITLDGCDNYAARSCALVDRTKAVRCADGSCVSSAAACKTGVCNKLCPNGACGDATGGDCRATNGCPVETPYLCSGVVKKGERCAKSPLDCLAQASCAPTSPYLCPDGSCVARIDQCKSFTAACQEGYERCSSTLTCEKKGTCTRVAEFCPVAAPIRCPMGECVADSKSCFQPKCQHPTPFRCADGTCRLNCPVWKERITDSVRSTAGKCASGYVQCTNGDCVSSLAECAIVPACPADRPARCWSGLCEKDAASCGTAQSCSGGQERCADGVCRASCEGLRFVGCPVGKVNCPMGECVDKAEECRACELSSAASSDKKLYQCLLGECVADITSCQTDVRNLLLPPIRATVPSYRSSTLNFIDPVSLQSVGSVFVPSGAIEELTQFSLSPVAQSEIRGIARKAPKYVRSCTAENPCLFTAGEVMPYEQMVRTGAFDISVGKDKFVFTYPVKLTIMIVQDHLGRITLDDLCLATLTTLDDGKVDWTCGTPEYAKAAVEKLDPATRKLVDSGLTLESTQGNFATLSTWVLHSGKMSVIVDPDYIPPAAEPTGLAWYWWLLIALACVLVLALIGYGIWRLYRFRVKYLQSKAYIARLQNEILEVGEMEMNQDIQGATVADQLQGFEFVSNPLFKKDHIEAAKKMSTDQKLKMLEDELQRLRVKTVGQHNEIKSLRKQLARSNASKGRGALDSDDEADDAAEDSRDRGGRVEFSAQDAELKDTRDQTLAAGAAAGAQAGRRRQGGEKWGDDEDDTQTQHSHGGGLLD